MAPLSYGLNLYIISEKFTLQKMLSRHRILFYSKSHD
jgi:hypothetical protein